MWTTGRTAGGGRVVDHDATDDLPEDDLPGLFQRHRSRPIATPDAPCRAECIGSSLLDDISVPRQDALEVPAQQLFDGPYEGSTIRDREPSNQPARPEDLPHSVRSKEQTGDAG